MVIHLDFGFFSGWLTKNGLKQQWYLSDYFESSLSIALTVLLKLQLLRPKKRKLNIESPRSMQFPEVTVALKRCA